MSQDTGNNAVEAWSRGQKSSRAKAYLKLQLESDEDNWIKQIIAKDPGISSKTIDQIHDTHDLFQPYKKQNFRSNFRSLKKAIDKNAAAVSFDQAALTKELEKYPKETLLKAGYPRWNHPENQAKKLLENDLKAGGLYEKAKPLELRKKRPEYEAFPEKIFSDRVFRERRKQIETPFWVDKRNKAMRKKTVDHGLESLTAEEASKF